MNVSNPINHDPGESPSIGQAQSIGRAKTLLPSDAVTAILLLVAASFFVALCARVTVPLPFTPVPLTLQNFAVLLVGLVLGSRRGFAALILYLLQGVSGLPVFNPTGPGGVVQLLGPTGGYLLAYPAVAFLAGYLFESGQKSFASAVRAAIVAELLLFASGVSWLVIVMHASWLQASRFGLYPFVPAEVLKVISAAAIAGRWSTQRS